MPKEMTRTVETAGDSVKYTYTGTAADGSSISYSFTVKYDGKDYPMAGTAPGGIDVIAIKRINSNTYEATQKKGGKVAANTKVEVSKDGKVTTITSKSPVDSTGYVRWFSFAAHGTKAARAWSTQVTVQLHNFGAEIALAPPDEAFPIGPPQP